MLASGVNQLKESFVMAVAVTMCALGKRFGETVAVSDFSLEIAPGEIFFLLGPSGCGKTTVLRLLAGFLAPDAGRLLMGGEDVTTMPPHRRDAGMVFQGYALWPHMSVAQNVAFGLEMRPVGRDERQRRVAEALALVRMSGRADDKPNQLSGGQQQRVALARALVIRPRCLLLDEPLSNLDAQLRLEMRSEIRRICREAGLTALYVTHDQEEALSVADRLAVMKDGRIRQIGTPREVYARPSDAFVAGFMGETNVFAGRIRSSDASGHVIQTAMGLLVSRVPGTWHAGTEVVVSIRPEAIRLGSVSGTENAWRGCVTESVYLGSTAQHVVRLETDPGAGGNEAPLCKVLEVNPRWGPARGVTAVSLAMDPDDVVVLPAS